MVVEEECEEEEEFFIAWSNVTDKAGKMQASGVAKA